MPTRWQLTAVTLCTILVSTSVLHADIYRWDNGQVIRGTEGIEPVPGVKLDDMQLEYAGLAGFDLTDASFERSNLTQADLNYSTLTRGNLTSSNLQAAKLGNSTLTGANLAEAVVSAADFWGTTSRGFTKEQLYSTASYKAKNLTGIGLGINDLTGWDFSGQNLADARLDGAMLLDAALTEAVVSGASFQGATSSGFTKEQLYSTASYKAKNLTEIELTTNDLTGWDFSGQDLTHARLQATTLTNAQLSGANLANADLQQSSLAHANLSGANLKNVYLYGALSFSSAIFEITTTYNQWTIFPPGFNPTAAGLTLAASPGGDLDADDELTSADIDLLASKIARRDIRAWWLPAAAFDVNSDRRIDEQDHGFWVRNLARTWYGDADLNGEFNSADFVQVFVAGKYEAGAGAGWSEGDWNGDGLFDSADFVIAFADGGYEQGPRTDVAAVPEPSGTMLSVIGLLMALGARRLA